MFIIPFPIGIQFDPLKLSATLIFLVGYLYRSVILHHRKKLKIKGGLPSFFLKFFDLVFFFGTPCFFFFIFYRYFFAIKTPK